MKKILFYILAVSVSGAFFSCEDSLDPYDDPNNRIAFTSTSEINYTFAYYDSEVVEDVVSVPVTAIGFVTDYDRSVSLRQVTDPERLDAVPGVHYLALDDPSMSSKMILQAGKTRVNIPITVYRDPSLEDDEYTLELELVPNDDFELGFPTRLRKIVTLADVLVKPSNWKGAIVSYFGAYGTMRHRVMNMAAAPYGQIIDYDWIKGINPSGSDVDMGEIAFWKGAFNTKLTEINAEREANEQDPLCEDTAYGGAILTFPQ